MPREDLATASTALQQAAIAVSDDDLAERLYDQSQQFAGHATGDRGPDHGRLARHENALQELAAETSGEAREQIERALELARSYREGVEGV